MAKSVSDRTRSPRLATRDEGAFCWFVAELQRSQPECSSRESDRLGRSRAQAFPSQRSSFGAELCSIPRGPFGSRFGSRRDNGLVEVEPSWSVLERMVRRRRLTWVSDLRSTDALRDPRRGAFFAGVPAARCERQRATVNGSGVSASVTLATREERAVSAAQRDGARRLVAAAQMMLSAFTSSRSDTLDLAWRRSSPAANRRPSS